LISARPKKTPNDVRRVIYLRCVPFRTKDESQRESRTVMWGEKVVTVGHHRHFFTFIDSDYIITPPHPPSLELFNIEIGQGLSKEFNFLKKFSIRNCNKQNVEKAKRKSWTRLVSYVSPHARQSGASFQKKKKTKKPRAFQISFWLLKQNIIPLH
jgi:hypothetical protein